MLEAPGLINARPATYSPQQNTKTGVRARTGGYLSTAGLIKSRRRFRPAGTLKSARRTCFVQNGFGMMLGLYSV
jgi:hypothetical protein